MSAIGRFFCQIVVRNNSTSRLAWNKNGPPQKNSATQMDKPNMRVFAILALHKPENVRYYSLHTPDAPKNPKTHLLHQTAHRRLP